MKILISGVHGFVGGNLVKALGARHQIYGLDIVSPEREGVVKTFGWDELDRLPEVDAVIHLAGKAHDTRRHVDPEPYFKVNTGLTQRLYDWFLKSQARKFIFFSSVKAAADIVESPPLTEDITPKPVGPYGESKIRAEEYIQARWHAPDRTTCILRPCMIHGPGNKGNLNLLFSMVARGVPWPLGAYDNRRSFTSINNLCYLLELMLEQPVATGIYNVGDDEPLSTNELVSLMCEVLGRRRRVWRVPRPLVKAVARIGDLARLPLDSERLRKLTENYVVDNGKIKRALGIDRLPTESAEGVRRTIKSFVNS